ncbi:MAG: dTMP kinase [Bacteroidales bacterium]|nr:dTMP kinase [Bacteroidales bacterium]
MLIVLEGLDGAGKSTQRDMISQHLAADGLQVDHLHFPRYDASVFGGMIGAFLRGDYGKIDQVDPHLVALLFAEDRHEAAADLRSRLEQGRCVILDRYVYSNIAYQGAKAGSKSAAEEMREWIFNLEYNHFGIPKPDLNLFLDVPISFVDDKLHNAREGSERDYLEGKSDIHEADIEFQKKVRAIYLRQCELDSSFIRIDCSDEAGHMLPAERIFEKIRKILK